MKGGAQLLANLGGEEGERWRAHEESLRNIARLWSLLFGAGTRLIGDPDEVSWPPALGERPAGAVFPWLEDAGGLVCWLETQDARSDPRAAGIECSELSTDAVWTVHDKAYAQRRALEEGFVPRCLRELICELDPADLADGDTAVANLNARIAAWPAWARARFTLKPRFGCNGRGRVSGIDGDADTAAIRGALPRLASRNGALLEPWLERTLDLSAQLYVDPAGETLMLGTLEQLLTPAGVYRGHRGWVDSKGRVFSGNDWDEPLREAAAALARAARDEGYFGPASLDAFAFALREEPGDQADQADQAEVRSIFRPVVEFNARFTLGTIALGLVRRALAGLKAPLGLEPGNRRGFVFALAAPPGGWRAATARAGHLAKLVPLWCDSDAAPDAQPALLLAETASDLDGVASDIASS